MCDVQKAALFQEQQQFVAEQRTERERVHARGVAQDSAAAAAATEHARVQRVRMMHAAQRYADMLAVGKARTRAGAGVVVVVV